MSCLELFIICIIRILLNIEKYTKIKVHIYLYPFLLQGDKLRCFKNYPDNGQNLMSQTTSMQLNA